RKRDHDGLSTRATRSESRMAEVAAASKTAEPMTVELKTAATAFEPPRHVAIIMDGNGRWASARGLPRSEGHRRGVEAVRRTVRAALDLGIGYLTLFSF